MKNYISRLACYGAILAALFVGGCAGLENRVKDGVRDSATATRGVNDFFSAPLIGLMKLYNPENQTNPETSPETK